MVTKAEEREKKALSAAEARRRSKLVKSSTALVPYGTPEELQEMVKRLRFLIPHGEKLQDHEIWGLSQSAVALGLNPFAKEICWIPGSGPFPQIRGVRRKGREQLDNFNLTKPDLDPQIIQDPEQRELYKIPEGALAYRMVGMIPEKRQKWVEDAKTLREALGPEAPYEAILENIGKIPTTTGIGYITQEEMWEKDNPRWWHKCTNPENNTEEFTAKGGGKYKAYVLRGSDPCQDCGKDSWATVNRYPHTQCAMKRAEAHFWYQECDLPFDISPSGEGLGEFDSSDDLTPISFTEGDFDDLPSHIKTQEEFQMWMDARNEAQDIEEHLDDMTDEELHEAAKKGSDALFGTDPTPTSQTNSRPYPPAVAREKIEAFYEHEEFKGRRRDEKRGEKLTLETAVVLNLNLCFEGNPDPDKDRHSVLAYLSRGASASIKDDFWTGAKLCAIEKWLEVKEWEGLGAGYRPRKESRLEAVSMLVTRMKEQGQQELL